MRVSLLPLLSACSAVGIGLFAGFARGLLSRELPAWQLSMSLAIPCLLGIAAAYEGSSKNDEHISLIFFAVAAVSVVATLSALSFFAGLLLAIPFRRKKH